MMDRQLSSTRVEFARSSAVIVKEVIDWVCDYVTSVEQRRVIPDVQPCYLRPLQPETARRAVHGRAARRGARADAGHDALAAPALPRVLPVRQLFPVDARRPHQRRARMLLVGHVPRGYGARYRHDGLDKCFLVVQTV